MEITEQGSWDARRAAEDELFLHARFTNESGASVTVRFTGRRLHLPMIHHSWGGIVEIYLDGMFYDCVDLYCSHHYSVTMSVDALTAGAHAVEVRLTSRKHPDSRACEFILGRPVTDLSSPPISTAQRLSERVLLRKGKHGDFFVLANDSGVSRTILDTGSWADDDVALFRKLIKNGDNVLDIGANIGHHTVAYSAFVGPSGKVYCFEPQRYIFEVLCANLMINECHNVFPQRLALGAASGKAPMYPIDYGTPGNFGALGVSTLHRHDDAEMVAVVALDDFVQEERIAQVDFIKIDVQTFELFVLRGAVNTLKRCRPRLFVEISPYWLKRLQECDYRDIYRLLRSAGYALCGKDLQPLGCAELEADATDEREWDIIALPEEQITSFVNMRV